MQKIKTTVVRYGVGGDGKTYCDQMEDREFSDPLKALIFGFNHPQLISIFSGDSPLRNIR